MIRPTVASTSLAHAAMLPKWRLASALMGGTASMRAAGEAYLPRLHNETAEAYKSRLSGVALSNGYRRAVRQAVGRVMSRPPVVNDAPDVVRGWLADINRQGDNLQRFVAEFLRSAAAKGMCHILVDMPALSPPASRARTLADDASQGVRPYAMIVQPENVIAAHSEYIGGVETLAHVRIAEIDVVREGYGERTVERVRVLEPGRFELWEKNDKNEWILVDEGLTDVGKVTMTTLYTERTAFMQSNLMFDDLAHKNIEHWQSSSLQNNTLDIARFPIFSATGVDMADEGMKTLALGPHKALFSSSPDARYGWIEHSGAAIGEGWKHLDRLKDEMQVLSLEPMMPRTGGMTATSHGIEASQANSQLKEFALNAQDALNLVLADMMLWARQPDVATVSLNTDYGLVLEADTATLMDMWRSRAISRETLWAELQRRDVLSGNFDPEDEAERIADEDTLGLFGGGSDANGE